MCSPFDAMAHGLGRLSRLSRKRFRVANQQVRGKPFNYPAGLIRTMRPGFSYMPHFDSKHSDMWVSIRHDHCRERIKNQFAAPFEWASQKIGPFVRHSFTAAAILTLNPPERELNPIDLNIRKQRWHSLVFNCSVCLPTASHSARISTAFNAQRLLTTECISFRTLLTCTVHGACGLGCALLHRS
jgi:hypothetical protein